MTKQCDASDMFAVHKGLEQGLREGADGIRSATSDERAEAAARLLSGTMNLLHAHHSSEDAIVWPLLLQRASEHAETITAGEAQHEKLGGALTAAESALAAWNANRDAKHTDALVAAVERLNTQMCEHLRYEERELVPLCEAHITQEEWSQLPGATMQKLEGDVLWIGLGLVRANMTDFLREMQEKHAPPPLWEAWLSVGEPLFNATLARVRDTVRAA